MTDVNSRLARLEQWRIDHDAMAERRFNKNDEDHAQLMTGMNEIFVRLSRIEGKLMYAAGVISVAGLLLGGLVGLIVSNASSIWQFIRHAH